MQLKLYGCTDFCVTLGRSHWLTGSFQCAIQAFEGGTLVYRRFCAREWHLITLCTDLFILFDCQTCTVWYIVWLKHVILGTKCYINLLFLALLNAVLVQSLCCPGCHHHRGLFFVNFQWNKRVIHFDTRKTNSSYIKQKYIQIFSKFWFNLFAWTPYGRGTRHVSTWLLRHMASTEYVHRVLSWAIVNVKRCLYCVLYYCTYVFNLDCLSQTTVSFHCVYKTNNKLIKQASKMKWKNRSRAQGLMILKLSIQTVKQVTRVTVKLQSIIIMSQGWSQVPEREEARAEDGR